MTMVTLEGVLAQARQLTPSDQAQLIQALTYIQQSQVVSKLPLSVDDEDTEDAAEQQETWAYLQRALDQDRLSSRPLFAPETDQV